MKILIAATPLTGHVNPLLAVGRAAAARGDDVLVLTDPAFRSKVEAAGLRFTAYRMIILPRSARPSCLPDRNATGASSSDASSIPCRCRPQRCGR